jgi:hypothetical protein
MAGSVFYRPYQRRLHKALRVEKTKLLKTWQIFVTFNLVSVAWVFFRGNTLGDCLYVFNNMFADFNLTALAVPQFGKFELMIQLAAMALVLVVHLWKNMNKCIEHLWQMPVAVRWSAYYALVMAVIFLGIEKHSNFMYFRF